jgi:hypothetical protein
LWLPGVRLAARAPVLHSIVAAARVVEGDSVSAIRWGLSTLDWRRHAVDPCANHPIGVYKAQCGHLLATVTPLDDEPAGSVCEACSGIQLHRMMGGDVS